MKVGMGASWVAGGKLVGSGCKRWIGEVGERGQRGLQGATRGGWGSLSCWRREGR